MVSMYAPHFFNWTEQLRNSGYEIYWIDVFDANTRVSKIDFVNQIIGWRNKIKYPKRYWIKRNFPFCYGLINRFNQRKLIDVLEEKMIEIQPDVVQSFDLTSAAVPILNVMQKFPHVKWIYSAWGNDLFYRQREPQDLRNMKLALPSIDYMFADCSRDHFLARRLGFNGTYLGTFPGGGGYSCQEYSSLSAPFHGRRIIAIKGYQGKLGRGNKILQALFSIEESLSHYNIIVFGADNALVNFSRHCGISEWPNFFIHQKIPHTDVLRLLGKSFLYIGNSISDGMPNTLLEAIVMGAFPIQSNPGGATAEIIIDQVNGYLIKDPEDYSEIRQLILQALDNLGELQKGVEYNNLNVKPKLEREVIQKQVLERYKLVEKEL